MLFDLNELNGTLKRKKYDVCISGAGPAGITLARNLASAGKNVALLEAGNTEYTDGSQSVYEGESTGLNYWNGVQDYRLRYFGGTSGHWGGLCSYFDEEDFEKEVNGLPGWPIKRSDLFKYFDQAKEILDLPENSFVDTEKWPGENFRTFDVSQSPPTRFNTKYLEEISKSEKIDLYINATLTNIDLSKQLDQVTHLDVSDTNLKKYKFTAQQYILAMGAIENARILLASNTQMSDGVGNTSDMVGRCFMEHFNVNYGRFAVDNSEPWSEDVIHIQAKPSLYKALNVSGGEISFHSNATVERYGRAAALKDAFYGLVCESDTATDLLRKVQDFDCEGDGIISSMIEQSPNLESRVTLDTSKADMFDLPRVSFNWAYNELDLKTIRTLGMEVAKEMARLGYARVQLADYILDESLNIDVSPHAHQMGTTRMSDDPKYGVVDKNCKVHGIKNMYISGSSVYPTGGACNPTFTLVMLALRLGEHLKA